MIPLFSQKHTKERRGQEDMSASFLLEKSEIMLLTYENIGTQSVQELFFCDRNIRRTFNSNDLVKFFVAMYSRKGTGNL